MENNTAVVVKLKNISPIEGADKIKRADIYMNNIRITQVVVGSDAIEDSIQVYFDSNLCLFEKVIEDYRNTFKDSIDEVKPDLARYLGKNYRVRTIKLKGIISNGLIVEPYHFYKYFKNEKEAKSTLVEGYSFDKIGETNICKKYIVPINIQSTGKKKKGKGKTSSRMIPGSFNFHIDTDNLLKNSHKIKPDDVISISSKWHGTSSICSNCLVKKKLKWFEKILKKFKINIIDKEYDYIYASRRVVKNGEFSTSVHFYDEDIWTKAGKDNFAGKLNKGETVYFEIVGYLSNGKYIQSPFDYGCEANKYDIRVYRITSTNEDGKVVEYGWQAMKERCIELNVKPVKEYYFGRAKDLFPELSIEEHWNSNFIEKLKLTYLEKDSVDCKNKVPDEGIVVRRESLYIDPYKLKSEKFILFESKKKDEEEVDIEDAN